MKTSILHQLHLCIIISLAGGTFQPYTVWEKGTVRGTGEDVSRSHKGEVWNSPTITIRVALTSRTGRIVTDPSHVKSKHHMYRSVILG